MTRHIRYCGLLRLVIQLRGQLNDPHYTVEVWDQSKATAVRAAVLAELRLAPYKRAQLRPEAANTITLVAFEAMQFLSAMDDTSDLAHELGQFEYGETEDRPVIRHLTIVR